jgi:4,5-DOPA dioxygenase extradiol
MTMQPALFISHGAPDLALGHSPARSFLDHLRKRLERPDAIVIVSAHHEAARPSVRSPERFKTWHDFSNFDRRLFAMRYEPSGDEALAAEVQAMLAVSGLDAVRDPSDLIDHGAWVPLSLLFPKADIPLVMVSIDPRRDARWHHALGQALAPLRQRNILLIGSGSISHNLRAVFSRSGGEDKSWVEDFTAWLDDRVHRGDRDALLRAMEAAPEALRNHPTDEHLLPFFFALGAGGAAGVRLHHSYTHEVLAMDAYAFGAADTLARLQAPAFAS